MRKTCFRGHICNFSYFDLIIYELGGSSRLKIETHLSKVRSHRAKQALEFEFTKGQKISGIYLFYLAFILVTAVPIIFRDEILGKIFYNFPQVSYF